MFNSGEDLLTAENKGQQACKAFISSRLVEQSMTLYDQLQKMKLCTFKSMAVMKKVKKTSNGMIQLRTDRSVFSCLAIIPQTRSIDGYACSACLSLRSSAMVAGKSRWFACQDLKAKLLYYLEEHCQMLTVVSPSAWILDEMAILQSLQGSPSTFADTASVFLQLILTKHHTAGGRVDILFD